MFGLQSGVGLAKTTVLAVLLLAGNHDGVGAVADDMMVAQRSFADALTTNLYQNENECTSSLGVSMAFDLVYSASVGESRKQLEAVFGYGSSTSDKDSLVWKEAALELSEIYQGSCLYEDEEVATNEEEECDYGREPLVRIANSLWVRNDVPLNASYAAVVGSLATQLDFSDKGAGGIVNDWVETSTNGLIDSIVKEGPLPANWILVAINSIYLKASWMLSFQERFTNQDVFYTSALRDSPTNKPARFMHQVDYFQYSHTALKGFQVLRLPFSGDDEQTRGLSMVFVLPHNNQDDEAVETVSSAELWSKLSSLERTKVALALPRFKFESMYGESLKASLKSTGLVAPFEGELCILAGSCASFVDHVVQKTVIDVNEEGVEAAAVTSLGFVTSLPPPDSPVLFLCDHPFQFFIYDSNQEVFLFEGQVSNPGVPEGVPQTAALEAFHRDKDFWKSNFFEEPFVVSSVAGDEDADGETALLSDCTIADITVTQRSFADAFTANLYRNENECSSSLGMSMAFDLINPASVGKSSQQLRKVFGFPCSSASNDNSPLAWEQAAAELTETYKGQCFDNWYEKDGNTPELSGQQVEECSRGREPLVRIANSIWVRDGVALNTSYTEAVGNLATQLNFDDRGAGGIVNDWVDERTNGLIDSIVEDGPLPINWMLVAVNTIYLKASWLNPFFETMTSQDAFYTSALRDSPADKSARFMHQVGFFDYSHTALPGYQVLRLPFSPDNELTMGLSMFFVLPVAEQEDEDDEEPRREPVTSEELWSQMSLLEVTGVAMALPRFKFDSKYEGDSLITSLQSTGLEAPFKGELCVERGHCNTSVDHVVQKTVIEVNEMGVEAAAATLISFWKSALPPGEVVFLCDHPFQFFIYDSNQEVFLFEGRVSNPGIPEGAPETAALDVSHEDESFWRDYLNVDPAALKAQAGGVDDATHNNLRRRLR